MSYSVSVACTCNSTNPESFFFLALFNSLLNQNENISGRSKRVVPIQEPLPIYDFIVIGGGVGGSITAALLSEIPAWKVLLIEAGPDEPAGSQVPSLYLNYLRNPVIDWQYRTEPESLSCWAYPERRCTYSRGRVLGGSSVLNGMMYTTGLQQDFDQWASLVGSSQWNYTNVKSYFQNVTIGMFPYNVRMIDDILQAAQESGLGVSTDLNGREPIGFSQVPHTTKNGTRLSSSRMFLWPIRHRTNLHILLNSTVTKILIDTKRKRTIGIAYRENQSGTIRTVRIRKEVILAAGSIGDPQLLLLSGIGRETAGIPLLHHLPGVGLNLHNHVNFQIPYTINWNSTDDLILTQDNVGQYLSNQMGPLSSIGLGHMTGRLNSPYTNGTTYPDIQIFFVGLHPQCPEGQHNGTTQIKFVPTVIHTRSRGNITLSSPNPMVPPRIHANHFQDPIDLKILIAAVRLIQKLVQYGNLKAKYHLEMAQIPGDCGTYYQFDSDDFWGCTIRNFTGVENHQGGTCRMGPSNDRYAVVDSELRVFGLKGLRILDGSIIPQPLSSNTAPNIYMLAAKGCDYIKGTWLGSRVLPPHSGASC